MPVEQGGNVLGAGPPRRASASAPARTVDRRVATRRRTGHRQVVRWGAELVVVAVALGWARWLSVRAAPVDVLAADRVRRLSEANDLLSSLHEVAQALPSSLDMEQALDSTVATLRSFWDLHALAILVRDETSERWMVARQEGVRLSLLVEPEHLPAALTRAARGPAGATALVRAWQGEPDGLSPAAGSGLYAPLHARGQLVGLIAVEHGEPGHFGSRDVELLEGFTESVALSLDNARWFARLRTVGADAERTRIAGELHDRVGQSLASLGFELDRLSRYSADEELRPGIDRLRTDLRGAMGEIRDTLYDLRTDVSEDRGMVQTLESFLDRVGRRTGVPVDLDVDACPGRLPLLQEREMWRVAQEAVTNAERHARPQEICVRWHCDGTRAALEVADDGCGFEVASPSAHLSQGILAMRERAASIGAHLSILSAPGGGTRVRCSLGAP